VVRGRKASDKKIRGKEEGKKEKGGDFRHRPTCSYTRRGEVLKEGERVKDGKPSTTTSTPQAQPQKTGKERENKIGGKGGGKRREEIYKTLASPPFVSRQTKTPPPWEKERRDITENRTPPKK